MLIEQSQSRPRVQTPAVVGDDENLLTSNQVRERIGNVSHMCLWRWQRDERVSFPHPIMINHRNYWRLGDLRRWQRERTETK